MEGKRKGAESGSFLSSEFDELRRRNEELRKEIKNVRQELLQVTGDKRELEKKVRIFVLQPPGAFAVNHITTWFKSVSGLLVLLIRCVCDTNNAMT